MIARKLILTTIVALALAVTSYSQPGPPQREHHFKQLQKTLKLNEEQSVKVKEILKATDAKLTELQSKAEMEREKEMEVIDKVFAAQDEQIKKVLDDTQKKKYDKLKEEQEMRMPEGPDGPGGPGGPEGFGPPPPPDGGGDGEPPFAE